MWSTNDLKGFNETPHAEKDYWLFLVQYIYIWSVKVTRIITWVLFQEKNPENVSLQIHSCAKLQHIADVTLTFKYLYFLKFHCLNNNIDYTNTWQINYYENKH